MYTASPDPHSPIMSSARGSAPRHGSRQEGRKIMRKENIDTITIDLADALDHCDRDWEWRCRRLIHTLQNKGEPKHGEEKDWQETDIHPCDNQTSRGVLRRTGQR
jgi:hypothetical protein